MYLSKPDRDLLDEVAARSGLSRAEILRRGLRRVGAEVLAAEHPVLRFLDDVTGNDWPSDTPDDVGERHDHYLTEPESARGPKPKK